MGFKAVRFEGEAFDVVAYIDKHFIRIQVKSTCKVGRPELYAPTGQIKRKARYSFTLKKSKGRYKTRAYECNDFDLICCIALDVRKILFFTYDDLKNENGSIRSCQKIKCIDMQNANTQQSLHEAYFKFLQEKL